MAALAQQVIEHHHFIRGAHLGHHQRGWRRVGRENGLHIFDAKLFAQAVDAQDAFDPIVGLRACEQREREPACLALVLRRNAVFEFDADDVRAAGERLGKHVGLEPRGENKTAARAYDGLTHAFSLLDVLAMNTFSTRQI